MCTAASDEPSTERHADPPNAQNPRKGPSSWAYSAILVYQEHLSALKMGPTCRFDPTCSSYALNAYATHGFIRATLLTVGRLARCGPWHPGGWDPVPPRRPRRSLWLRLKALLQ
ncbi:MAG TPA: membrane protein insertion efficiency factor YidD [Candidatus Corynebacterium gallistercoris]|uniref:Putative membrane protein insertion efficiency factor n=1 Tax=Candidatus Corynebacterium gallistercoris TaxID=2838530 RepID=A0A9D1UQD5_9CORY|nr:membrane protein insertion efficiency factor YidD [Candidatus Corynebacterium gallistercoris]